MLLTQHRKCVAYVNLSIVRLSLTLNFIDILWLALALSSDLVILSITLINHDITKVLRFVLNETIQVPSKCEILLVVCCIAKCLELLGFIPFSVPVTSILSCAISLSLRQHTIAHYYST